MESGGQERKESDSAQQTSSSNMKITTGQLTTKGTRGPLSFSRAVSSQEQFTAWANRSELLPFKYGSKSRKARVWLNTFDQSNHFQTVFMEVRVPSIIPEQEQHCLAMHKAHKRGKRYSQIMWQRSGGAGSFEALAFRGMAIGK